MKFKIDCPNCGNKIDIVLTGDGLEKLRDIKKLLKGFPKKINIKL